MTARRPRSAFRLDPAASLAWGQRAGPQANLPRSQGRVGHFKNDAAHVLVGEEIVAGGHQVVSLRPPTSQKRGMLRRHGRSDERQHTVTRKTGPVETNFHPLR